MVQTIRNICHLLPPHTDLYTFHLKLISEEFFGKLATTELVEEGLK